jgi:alanyl-tRNA synthetase
LTGHEIRRKFLDFFAARGHRVLPSASLIPADDPSLLWTAAGMVPFKPYFTGAAKPPVPRITTCQKCLRTPDIESVGKTARHHTFFEMLGNFSFGDYFKERAIPWAWEFVTEHLGIPGERLWVSIYLDDDEAFDIWHRVVGVPAERIVRMGKDTNFWEIGVGPCGPCSEIHVDLGPERGCGRDSCAVGCDCDRFLEIWNLVFIQFNKDEAGNYTPLASKGIDTGMGLERVASVLQGVPSNFDTDLFREIMDRAAEVLGLTGRAERPDGEAARRADVALKVIADHARAVTFAVADGAMPSNEGRGYVLRRLLRRAARYGRLLGVTEPFLYRVAEAVINQMGEVYPELVANRTRVTRIIRSEEERFGATLAQGSDLLEQIMARARQAGQKTIAGEEAFRLYDTYGFPLELTKEIAAEEGFTVDEAGFRTALEEQRERARRARQEHDYLSEEEAFWQRLRDRVGTTTFVGYHALEGEARILALLREGDEVSVLEAGREGECVLDLTPCYATAGGQVSDRGVLEAEGARAEVVEVTAPVEGLYVHRVAVAEGALRVGAAVRVRVDAARRKRICRNHSATHLLHRALREVLGDHVNQAGSLVEPERLRFDFTHYAALEPEEFRAVEQRVNEQILANLPVTILETTLEEARARGAMALFGEKYGERVRLVQMGDYSLELCGGTHVGATAEIGAFKLVGEGSIGAGLRRVEAVTGDGVLEYLAARERELQEIARLVKAGSSDVVRRVEGLVARVRELEAEVQVLQDRLAAREVMDLLNLTREVDGVKVLAARVQGRDTPGLRGMVDLLRERLGSGVVVLGSTWQGKVNLVAGVTADLVARGYHAGNIIREVAALVGGGGGGRPDLAQAGGKDPSRLDEALAAVSAIVARGPKC